MNRPTDHTGGREQPPSGRQAFPPPAHLDPSGVLGGATSFDQALARWAADAAVDDAARARTRERWLRIQAEEEASLAGVLLDLAEQGRPVVLEAGSHRLRGHLVGLGIDFAAVRTEQEQDVLVRLAALDAVHTEPGGRPVVGDRSPALDVDLAGVLGPVAAERPQVVVRTRSGTAVRGQLRSASASVIRLRTDTDPPAAAWLPLEAITVLVLGP